jgi:hypothetical protein
VSRVLPALLDGILVVVFAAIGRRSHAEGLTLAGIATTAWPFIAGAVGGWALGLLAVDDGPRSLAFGAVVVAAAVVIGMLLRRASGEGTAPAFVVVATVTLAVLLLGWRLVARVVA